MGRTGVRHPSIGDAAMLRRRCWRADKVADFSAEQYGREGEQ